MPGASLPFSPAREPTEDGVLASLITPCTRARKEQLSRMGEKTRGDAPGTDEVAHAAPCCAALHKHARTLCKG
jgi:hypothetical protein